MKYTHVAESRPIEWPNVVAITTIERRLAQYDFHFAKTKIYYI